LLNGNTRYNSCATCKAMCSTSALHKLLTVRARIQTLMIAAPGTTMTSGSHRLKLWWTTRTWLTLELRKINSRIQLHFNHKVLIIRRKMVKILTKTRITRYLNKKRQRWCRTIQLVELTPQIITSLIQLQSWINYLIKSNFSVRYCNLQPKILAVWWSNSQIAVSNITMRITSQWMISRLQGVCQHITPSIMSLLSRLQSVKSPSLILI
jgi:hypothetical protein